MGTTCASWTATEGIGGGAPPVGSLAAADCGAEWTTALAAALAAGRSIRGSVIGTFRIRTVKRWAGVWAAIRGVCLSPKNSHPQATTCTRIENINEEEPLGEAGGGAKSVMVREDLMSTLGMFSKTPAVESAIVKGRVWV